MSLIRTRLALGTVLFLGSLATAAALVHNGEELEPQKPVPPAPDYIPTIFMSFVPASRSANLEDLGLSGGDFDEALRFAAQLDEAHDAIVDTLRRTEPAWVSENLCRQTVPVPYRAARLLIAGPAGDPRLVDVRRASKLEEWQAYPHDRVPDLLERWERSAKRADVDTAKALWALISGRIEQALAEPPPGPWRRSEEGGRLEDAQPDRTLLARFMASAVVLAEIVEADPVEYGCGQ